MIVHFFAHTHIRTPYMTRICLCIVFNNQHSYNKSSVPEYLIIVYRHVGFEVLLDLSCCKLFRVMCYKYFEVPRLCFIPKCSLMHPLFPRGRQKSAEGGGRSTFYASFILRRSLFVIKIT